MDFSRFTKLYPLSKTLRFELKPVGETADYIEDFGSDYLKSVVAADDSRFDDYQAIKILIDDLHRSYINDRLGFDQQGVSTTSTTGVLGHPRSLQDGAEVISAEDLQEAFNKYQCFKKKQADLKDKAVATKAWEDCQTTLRKQLISVFADKDKLFKASLISKELPDFLRQRGDWDEYQELVESFRKFTSYFTGFHENRKNMYVADDKVTSIANRAINENLPRFFDNVLIFQNIVKHHSSVLDFADAQTLLAEMGANHFDEVFQPTFYLKLFSQRGIESYEKLVSGVKGESDELLGLNQQINQYRQQYAPAAEADKKLTRQNFPTMARLHKQILAEASTSSFSYEPFINDQEMLADLQKMQLEFDRENGFFGQLIKLMHPLNESDPAALFIRGNALNSLSNDWLGSFALIERTFDYYLNESGVFKNKKEKLAYSAKRKDGGLFSFAEIDLWVNSYLATQDAEVNASFAKLMAAKGDSVQAYFAKTLQLAFEKGQSEEGLGVAELEAKLDELVQLDELEANRRPPKTKGDDDIGDKGFHQVKSIQQCLDLYLSALNLLKPLHLVHKRKQLDAPETQDKGFYNEFSAQFELMTDGLLTIYNKTRNHLSKKKFKVDKVKINFDNPNLMNGWDANKETDNSCVLFEKDGNYYLGVMHPKHRRLFDYTIGMDELDNQKKVEKKDALRTLAMTDADDTASYRKIVYKLLPGANKMLPKVFFSASRMAFFNPSEDIHRIRNSASHSKSGKPQKGHEKAEFNLADCHTLINFFKASIERHYEWRQFGFQFSPTESYQDISQFYKELQDQAYRLEFHHIKQGYIDDCIASGKLFLFHIYNKDFSPHSTGTPNLHTLYWRGLFEQGNLDDVVLKLNGEAEMFFRRHSIKKQDRIIHQAGEAIKRKNAQTAEQTSQFPYDIVKDKRYTQDKFFLHIPITLNHKASGVPKFNDAINQAVNSQTRVIGIDRGERHLLYYCVVDQQGNIVQDEDGNDCQGSLNTIKPTGGGAVVDYQYKLNQREKERDAARKSWTSVENIKELKAGYLSQVVHKLTELMTEHNAIVCLEDLNFGFKRGRFKVEKQVYQKFEKALIDKLNYLVNKQESDPQQPRHYRNALQLTAPFVSFEKLGKQSGALYYVRADYTSKICPVTGFVNLLKPYYQSVEQSKKFFSEFDKISFNGQHFEFTFDYKNTNPNAKLEGAKTRWTVTSHGQRLMAKKNDKGRWVDQDPIEPSKEIKAVFEATDIDWASGDNLLEDVLAQDSKAFFQSLLWGLRLTLQMRNSNSGSTRPENDYLLSPIADAGGRYYDSRHAGQGLPSDADANGAYHIALKGVWNIEQIRQHDWMSTQRLNLTMSNEQWFEFIQNKPYRQPKTEGESEQNEGNDDKNDA